MLDQIISLIKQSGQQTVVDNPEIPKEYNQEILSDATKTITSGFQNILAGGGLQNILDLFKGGGSSSSSGSNGIAGLLKNPIVSMMVGYFINKLVSKYNMSPSSASSVANNLIPSVLNGLVTRTTNHNPENDAFDFNDLIGTLTGGNVATSESGGGFNFQNLLDQFVGGGGSASNSGGGFDLQDIIGQVTNGARQSQQQRAGGGGLADLIQGFLR